MAIITGLKAGKSREKKLNVFLDGKYSFSLLAEVALKEGLKVEQELSAGQVEALTRTDRYQRCLNAAIRFLGYRPRSEAEVRQRLQRHGFDGDSINKAIARLKELGFVDDIAFANYWKENRETFSPRSRWLTGQELQRKGLDSGVIEQVVGEVDDSDSAYRAALVKARRLSSSDYPEFRRRLGEYLRRRGFNYQLINETVARIWKEHESSHG
jgi:regulatory protein